MVDAWEEGWAPGRGHWVVFLGKTLYSVFSLYQGGKPDVRDLNPGVIQSAGQDKYFWSIHAMEAGVYVLGTFFAVNSFCNLYYLQILTWINVL